MAFVQNPPPQNSRPHRIAPDRRLLGVLVGACLLFGLGLGATDLWAPDEPRYGAIAEELRSGRHGAEGLVLLHLNERPYTQKPPLYFWLAAAFGLPFGRVTELAARLPSFCAGLACVGITAWLGRRLLRNPTAALLAAGFLATSFRFAFSARRAQLDVLLTAFELIAIACFVAVEFRPRPACGPPPNDAPVPAAYVAGLHAALGLAAIVKGPVGWLPLLVIAAYLVWEGRGARLRRYGPAWAWALSLAPLALWITAAIALAPSGFAHTAVVENVFGRFFSGTSHARPFYYYVYQLPADFLPWSLLLPLALAWLWKAARSPLRNTDTRASERRAAARLLACWILVPLLFFSLSAGKRGVYLLPVFPALALLCARIVPTAPAAAPHPQATRWTRRAAIAVGSVALIELALFVGGMPWLNPHKSPRPIANAAAHAAGAQETVGVYGLTPLEGGIRYYGGPRVESLRNPEQLRDYLAAGGRLVILRDRHFDSLATEMQLREIASFREGRRRLTLAERVRP